MDEHPDQANPTQPAGADPTQPAGADPTQPAGADPTQPAGTDTAQADAVVDDLPVAEPTGDVLPVDLRDWVDFSVDEARRVRVFRTDALQQDLWCLEPQQASEVLRYVATDVTYTVLAGRAWFVTEQGDAGLDPLASLLVPAGVTHGIDNRAPDPLVVLAVGSPPGDLVEPQEPLTRLGQALRAGDTTGGIGKRLMQFLQGS